MVSRTEVSPSSRWNGLSMLIEEEMVKRKSSGVPYVSVARESDTRWAEVNASLSLELNLKCYSLVLRLIQGRLNSVHNLASYYCVICFSIILASAPRCSDWNVSFLFSNQYFECRWQFLLCLARARARTHTHTHTPLVISRLSHSS